MNKSNSAIAIRCLEETLGEFEKTLQVATPSEYMMAIRLPSLISATTPVGESGVLEIQFCFTNRKMYYIYRFGSQKFGRWIRWNGKFTRRARRAISTDAAVAFTVAVKALDAMYRSL